MKQRGSGHTSEDRKVFIHRQFTVKEEGTDPIISFVSYGLF